MHISLLHYLFLAVGFLVGSALTAVILIQRSLKKDMVTTSEHSVLHEKLIQHENDVEKLNLEIIELKKENLEVESAKNKFERDLTRATEEISQLTPYKTEATRGRDKIISLVTAQSELSQELKQLPITVEKVNCLENKLESSQIDNNKQTGLIAELQEKLSQLESLEQEHKELKQQFSLLQSTASDRQAEIAKISTLLHKERDSSTEKLNLLQEAKEELAHRFKTVAQEIFEDKGTKFNTKQEKDLGNILNPLKEQLSSFNKRINAIHESSTKDQASLRQELETLRKSNHDLNKEAKNLSQALKGDQKVQGNWGEMILEKVLEHSGLRKGIEYETQTGLRDDDNKLFKPDVVVHLPEGRAVVIDSKVSLVAYEESCGTDDPNKKEHFLAAHVLSVRKHIKELSDKDYSNLPGLKSPDFVLMFMPIESAFMAAFQKEESLFQYGFDRRIIVVTPSTLLATLRTIQNIWQFERQNQNTKEIANRASKMYEKLRLYIDSMEDLGKQLNKAQSTYDVAMGRLSTGRGNLVNQAGELVKLGVKVKKEVSQNIINNSQDLESKS